MSKPFSREQPSSGSGTRQHINHRIAGAKEVVELVEPGEMPGIVFVSSRTSPGVHGIAKISESSAYAGPDLAITKHANPIPIWLCMVKHRPLASTLCCRQIVKSTLMTNYPCDRVTRHFACHLGISKAHHRHIDAGLLPLLGASTLTQHHLQVR